VIRATSRPAARETHPMGSSRGGISLASAAQGSEVDVMSLARPASKASAHGTLVPGAWNACFFGSCAPRLRQFLASILPIPAQRLLAETVRQFFVAATHASDGRMASIKRTMASLHWSQLQRVSARRNRHGATSHRACWIRARPAHCSQLQAVSFLSLPCARLSLQPLARCSHLALIATIRARVSGQKTCHPHQGQASAAFQHPSAGMPR
jgi:hypothetical protein